MASYHAGTPDSVYIPPSHHVITTSEIQKIREWLLWSIFNIFFGWGLAGLTPLLFSMLCRYNKRNNDLHGAQAMSNLAFILNIVATLSGIAGWVFLIVLLVHLHRIYDAYYPK
jgi:hypothetical protein